MNFSLNYDRLILLDAENLAECGIKTAYFSILPALMRYVPTPADVQEFLNPRIPRYLVRAQGADYPIYSPELRDDGGRDWGRAAHAFFKIVNDQLEDSEHRLFAINRRQRSGRDVPHERGVRSGAPVSATQPGLALPAKACPSLVRSVSRLGSLAKPAGGTGFLEYSFPCPNTNFRPKSISYCT